MASKTRVWGTLNNGEFEIITLEDDVLEEALQVLGAFFSYECICIGTEINLPESSQARKELTELCKIVNEDHVSLAVRYVPTKAIVGVSFNKLQYIDETKEVPFFVEFRDKRCTSENAKALMSYMIEMDEEIDPFQLFKIDCLLELMFLAVLPEYGKKGLGNALVKYSIELGRELSQGIGVEKIPKHLQDKRPKAVTALFTSNFSQKCGKVNNFKVLNRVPHKRFIYKGKPFSERIGPMHPDSAQVAIQL
ncbi:uncharacterized protein LOC129954241 isoform X2 [Eupeodes corollae]|uniref:uncharacterized protein LOC129954241 isoform X2 n=1 Tax=Eupeodes corollae TaxID=290404 RepID=UPI0024908041|nr:uncharacterized protein LOC129954241 isoform X2 [Eupeodes corollae]